MAIILKYSTYGIISDKKKLRHQNGGHFLKPQNMKHSFNLAQNMEKSYKTY